MALLHYLHFCSFQELLPALLRSFSLSQAFAAVSQQSHALSVGACESCPTQVVRTHAHSLIQQTGMLLGVRHFPRHRGGCASFHRKAQVSKDVQHIEGVRYTGLPRATQRCTVIDLKEIKSQPKEIIFYSRKNVNNLKVLSLGCWHCSLLSSDITLLYCMQGKGWFTIPGTLQPIRCQVQSQHLKQKMLSFSITLKIL